MAAKSKREKMNSILMKGVKNNIQDQLQILPEIEELIPPLTEEELSNLEKSILAEGCREPLIVWEQDGDYILVDGHNRYKICKANQVDFGVKVKHFGSLAEAKNWMLANQMSRRNLSPLQMSYLRGLKYEADKQAHGGLMVSRGAGGQKVHSHEKTSEKLAEIYGVNEKTIRRDAKFSQGLNRFTGSDQQLRWGILNGQIQAKKQSISELADQDDAFLEQLRLKLEKTNNLDKAIKLIHALENDAKPGDVQESVTVYKQLTSLLKKAAKVDKTDPKRKIMIKEAKDLFEEYLKLI